MRKPFITLGVLVALGFGTLFASAQSTQPPGLDFPTLDGVTDTVTTTPTSTATTMYVTTTPTRIASQTITDDAETGPELYILIGLSLLGGLGIFFIKKYFDLKKYVL